MIGMIETFVNDFKTANFDVTVPEFTQEMSEKVYEIIGDYDGWIIGDDPATRRVLEAGVKGNLRFACWGMAQTSGFCCWKIWDTNRKHTRRFCREVACHYVTALARNTFVIDSQKKVIGINQLGSHYICDSVDRWLRIPKISAFVSTRYEC